MNNLAGFKSLYSSAAYRMSDIMNDAITRYPWSVGKWMAFRLSDGESDGIAYDTRAECVKHQFWEKYYCYIKLIPMGVNPQMCQANLSFYRAAYDAGYRILDPEQPDFIPPSTNEQFRDQVSRFSSKKA